MCGLARISARIPFSIDRCAGNDLLTFAQVRFEMNSKSSCSLCDRNNSGGMRVTNHALTCASCVPVKDLSSAFRESLSSRQTSSNVKKIAAKAARPCPSSRGSVAFGGRARASRSTIRRLRTTCCFLVAALMCAGSVGVGIGGGGEGDGVRSCLDIVAMMVMLRARVGGAVN